MAAAKTQPGWGAPQTLMQRFKSRFTRGRVHKGRGGEETTTPQATYEIPRDPKLKPGEEGYIVPGSRGPGLKPSFKDTQSREEGGTGFGSWTGRKPIGKPGGVLSRMRRSWNQMTQANLAAIDRDRAERGLPMRKQAEMDPQKPYNIFGSPRKAPRRTMKTVTPALQHDKPDYYRNLRQNMDDLAGADPKTGTPGADSAAWDPDKNPLDPGSPRPKAGETEEEYRGRTGIGQKKERFPKVRSLLTKNKRMRDAAQAAIKAKIPELEAGVEARRQARKERKEAFKNIVR